MFWIVLWLLSLVWIIVSGVISWFSWWFFGGLIGIAILTIPLIWWGLAPRNLFFTFVEEGTAKAVVKGGELYKFLITWKDHTFKVIQKGKQKKEKDNWKVVETKGKKHLFGGLRFYGFPPIHQIFKYKFRWTHLHEDGSVVKHEEWLDSILLKTDLYVIEYPLTEKEAIEDIDGVPLGINLVMPMKISNPYEALFVVRRWLPLINGIVKATLRAFIAKYRFKEDLLNMSAGKGIGKKQKEKGISKIAKQGEDLRAKLQDELKEALIKKGKEEETITDERGNNIYTFGVLIQKKGTDIISIDPHPMYREATTLKYRAARDKEKTIIDAEAKAEAAKSIAEQKAIETAEMHSIIKRTLMKESELSLEEANKQAAEYVEYWKGSEEKVIEDWRFKGTEEGGLYAEAAKIMAVIETVKKRINSGKVGGKEEEDKKPSEPEKEETEEEKGAKFFEKLAEESKALKKAKARG